jgi:hypothetical protein
LRLILERFALAGTEPRDAVNLAITYRNSLPASRDAAARLKTAFAWLEARKAPGRPLRARTIAFASAESLRQQVRSSRVNAIVVMEGLDEALPDILELARSERMLSIETRPPDSAGPRTALSVWPDPMARLRFQFSRELAKMEGVSWQPGGARAFAKDGPAIRGPSPR